MNASMKEDAGRRIHAWDHFRDAIILLVVIWHCSSIYGERTRIRWFFIDRETGILFDVFVFASELFLLPLLFYISGHFAVASIEKRGAGPFLADKARRLLIPFVFGVTMLIPINFYLDRRALGAVSPGYFRYWIGTYFTQDLGPAHLWFLYVLFFFCVVYAVIWSAHRWLTSGKTSFAGVPSEPQTLFLLAFGLLTALALAVTMRVAGYASWTHVFGFKLFAYQPSWCALYVFYFFLGVYGAMRGWTWANGSLWRVAAWAGLFGGASVGLMFFRARFGVRVEGSLLLMLCNAVLHAFATLGALGAFATGFRLWCNRPFHPTRLFTVNSYGIYIVHQPIVVWLQYLLLGIRISAYLKFAIVFGLALPLSLLASHFVLRRLPVLRNVV